MYVGNEGDRLHPHWMDAAHGSVEHQKEGPRVISRAFQMCLKSQAHVFKSITTEIRNDAVWVDWVRDPTPLKGHQINTGSRSNSACFFILLNFVGSVKASCPRRDVTNACFWAPLQADWFRSSAAVVGFRFSRPSTSAAVAAGQDPTSLSLGISAQEINLQMQPCTVENGHPKPPFQVLVPITECLQIFTEEVTELARPLCLRRSEQVTELSWPPLSSSLALALTLLIRTVWKPNLQSCP